MPIDEHRMDWREETRGFRDTVSRLSVPAAGLLAAISAMENLSVLRAELPDLGTSPFACIPDLRPASDPSVRRSARTIPIHTPTQSVAGGEGVSGAPGHSRTTASPATRQAAYREVGDKPELTPPVFSLRRRGHETSLDGLGLREQLADTQPESEDPRPHADPDAAMADRPTASDAPELPRSSVSNAVDLPIQDALRRLEAVCGMELLGQLVNRIDLDALGRSQYVASAGGPTTTPADSGRWDRQATEGRSVAVPDGPSSHPAREWPIAAGSSQWLSDKSSVQPGALPELVAADGTLPALCSHVSDALPVLAGTTVERVTDDQADTQFSGPVARSTEYPAGTSAMSGRAPLGMPPDDAVEWRPMDGAAISDLVNDVLIEQARRHGVDLS